MSANDKQVGGDHYRKTEGEQHWDRIARMFGPGYFIGCATKYAERCLEKGHAVEDLEKAAHFCQKLAELIKAGVIKPNNEHDPHFVPPKAVTHARPLDEVLGSLPHPGKTITIKDLLQSALDEGDR